MTVTVISKLAIQGGADSPIIDALAAAKGFAVVADTTERGTIKASVKLGGFVVYRVDLPGFEYWNGSTWVGIGSSGGGGFAFPFTFSTTTADADPGAGTFRANNATPASATLLFVDDLEFGGTSVVAWLAAFDDNVGTPKGTVRLQSKSDATKWLEFPVLTYTAASGYSKIGLGTSRGPGGITTTAGDTVLIFDAYGVPANLNNQGLTNARSFSYNGETDNGNSGTADTIDWTNGDLQKSALTGNVTYTFVAPAGPGFVQLRVTQDGTGGRTITFPAAVLGSPPQPAPAAAAVTFYLFFYDGTNYYASPAQPWTNIAGAPTKGQSPVWDGTSWKFSGVTTKATDLTDANVSLAVSDGSRFIIPASTLTTTRAATLGTSGAISQEVVSFERYDTSANTDQVKNSLGTVIYTFPPNVQRMASFQFVGEWQLAAHVPITAN